MALSQTDLSRQPDTNLRSQTNSHLQFANHSGITNLTLGHQIETDFSPTQVHTYRANVSPGQYLNVIVDSKAIDVVVTLLRSGAKSRVEINTSPANSRESVFLVGGSLDEYVLKISSRDRTPASGSYTIRVEGGRRATKIDRDRFTAQRLLSDGIQLGENGNAPAESLLRAIGKLRRALQLWRASGDELHLAQTLNKVGEFSVVLGNAREALDYHRQALKIYKALFNAQGESTSLNHIGYAHHLLGETDSALRVYNQALLSKRSIGDEKGEAHALYGLGVTYLKLGELKSAAEYFDRALTLARATGDRPLELSALCGIGLIYCQRHDWGKALEYHRQALNISRGLHDNRSHALVLNILGADYFGLGDFRTALEFRNQALSLRRTLGDKRGQAMTLNGLASIYNELGDKNKALEYYHESFSLMTASGDKYGLAYVVTGMGYLHMQVGNLGAARDKFKQALALNRASGDRAGEALSLRNLGRVFAYLKDPRTAKEYLTEALSISRALGDPTRELSVLVDFARVEHDLNRLDEALAHVEASIAIIESARSSITSQDLRASYIKANRDFFELIIDLLMRAHKQRPSEGFESRAFQASERARARSLLDTLSASREEIRRGVDPALLEEQQFVWSQLSAKSANLTRTQNRNHTDKKKNASTKEIEALLRKAQDLDAQIRAASPRYAALTQPQILSVKDVQEQVLDDETMLLEYTLGPEHSYVWAVTKTSIKSYELPGRQEIESAARQVYELFTLKADLLYPNANEQLGSMLLRPVANELRKKRILIVAEGQLQYLPFGALPDPNRSKDPLILNHEIVMLPSASVLATLRRELSERRPAPNLLAVIADPVFDNNDERVRSGVQSLGDGSRNRQRIQESVLQSHGDQSNSKFASNDFERLVHSRTEAQQIISLLPDGKRQMRALDFAASRATATSADLRSYQIVHFATHSLLNNKYPELSGIVLSLVDEAGRPQNGFLRLFDIYNMNLGAELVVLSACQTALGKDVTGEGLVGLSRAFMYAGSPRVVASLWKVSDTSTSELMKRFYSNMFKENMTPSGALRAAQISMLSEKQWMAPYHWAGFVIQGEWN